MILTPEQREKLYNPPTSRNGLTNVAARWPDNIVHYQFTPAISTKDRNLIISALREIEQSTCLRFVQVVQGKNKQGNHISVTNNAEGCFAYVGYIKTAGQQVNLGNGCMYKGIIQHEFLHAVGFFHQQSSADRDSYVTIHLENVEAGQEHNFDKYSSAQVTNFGFEYDYGSIMHYAPYDFSKNGKIVMTAKFSGGGNMGQRDGPSASDLGKVNRMYSC